MCGTLRGAHIPTAFSRADPSACGPWMEDFPGARDVVTVLPKQLWECHHFETISTSCIAKVRTNCPHLAGDAKYGYDHLQCEAAYSGFESTDITQMCTWVTSGRSPVCKPCMGTSVKQRLVTPLVGIARNGIWSLTQTRGKGTCQKGSPTWRAHCN